MLEAIGGHLQGVLGNAPGRRAATAAPQPAKFVLPPVLRALRKEHCSRPFDASSLETQQALVEIWNAAFPEEPIATAEDGEHWKRLGFQSSTPGTDVRAGNLALHQLHRLAASRPQLFRRLAAEAQEAGYPLACSCFNVTQLLVIFFGLTKQPAVSPVSGARRAGPWQLRNFAELCGGCPEGPAAVLDELFVALAERLHDVWRLLRAKEGLSLMDFERALQEVYEANSRFWRCPHASLEELRALAVAGSLEAEDLASSSDSSLRRARGLRPDPCTGMSVCAWLDNCRAFVQSALGELGEQRTLGAGSLRTRPQRRGGRRSASCGECRRPARARGHEPPVDPPLFRGRAVA